MTVKYIRREKKAYFIPIQTYNPLIFASAFDLELTKIKESKLAQFRTSQELKEEAGMILVKKQHSKGHEIRV